jgi:pyrroloquinoline-quinone synthase
VLEHANTVELQHRCLKICEIGAQMRLLYTTALYWDYVAKDIPISEIENVEPGVQQGERQLLQA